MYSVHPTFTPESEYRYIAVRWTQYVLFKAPLPPLSKGGRGDGEGFGVRVVPYTDENRYSIPKSVVEDVGGPQPLSQKGRGDGGEVQII